MHDQSQKYSCFADLLPLVSFYCTASALPSVRFFSQFPFLKNQVARQTLIRPAPSTRQYAGNKETLNTRATKKLSSTGPNQVNRPSIIKTDLVSPPARRI